MVENITLPKTVGGWLFLIAQVTVVLATLLGTFWLVLAGRSAGSFAAVGVGVLFLFRFGDIATLSFKAFGIEAAITRAKQAEEDALKAANEAINAVEEANKTIDALKQLGMHLSSLTLPIVLDGSMRRATLEVAMQYRNTAKRQLEAMGCTSKQIESTLVSFDLDATLKMIMEIADLLKIPFQLVELHRDLWPSEQFNAVHLSQGFTYEVEGLRKYFRERTTMTPELESWINEIIRFQKTGEIDFDKQRALWKVVS